MQLEKKRACGDTFPFIRAATSDAFSTDLRRALHTASIAYLYVFISIGAADSSQ